MTLVPRELGNFACVRNGERDAQGNVAGRMGIDSNIS